LLLQFYVITFHCMHSPSPTLIFNEEGQALAYPKGGVGVDEMQPPPPQAKSKEHTHVVDTIIQRFYVVYASA
jgi:hypothetical protein